MSYATGSPSIRRLNRSRNIASKLLQRNYPKDIETLKLFSAPGALADDKLFFQHFIKKLVLQPTGNKHLI